VWLGIKLNEPARVLNGPGAEKLRALHVETDSELETAAKINPNDRMLAESEK